MTLKQLSQDIESLLDSTKQTLKNQIVNPAESLTAVDNVFADLRYAIIKKLANLEINPVVVSTPQPIIVEDAALRKAVFDFITAIKELEL
jgi:hypothetical protein